MLYPVVAELGKCLLESIGKDSHFVIGMALEETVELIPRDLDVVWRVESGDRHKNCALVASADLRQIGENVLGKAGGDAHSR